MADLMDIFSRFILPPLLGGAGGLVSGYASCGIEQRRQRLTHDAGSL